MSHEQQWADLAAPYALDALDPAERDAFEAHLGGCAQCRQMVDEARETLGLLAFAAPPVPPPPALRQRILDEARAVRPIGAARAQREARRAPARAAWAAVAASVLLALVAGGAYWRERGHRVQLARQHAEVRAALAERDSLLGTLLAPEVQTVRLSATGEAPSVRLFWNRERGMVVVTAAQLPPAAPGRTYQLWGIPEGGSPVSLGTFNTAAGGRARVVLEVPRGAAMAVSAITEEPEGGSPQPTTTPFLVGQWGEAAG